MVSTVVSFTFSQKVLCFLSFDSCTLSSFALLQVFLPNEPLEIFYASTTFDFSMSVCNSNLFRVTSFLERFCDWRCSISFWEGFWFTFFRFYPWYVVKSPGRFFFFSFLGFFPFFFIFLFFLYGPQVDPFFYSFYFIFL